MIEHAGVCSIYNSFGDELVFSHGNGGYVYDKDGRKYIDFVLGFGPVIIGHNDPSFNSYIISHLSHGIHMPSYTTHHEEFLNLLCPTYDKSFSFFKTSSESVTAAFRISVQVTGKKGIIRCGYIGWHDAQIANTCSWHEYPYSDFRNTVKFTKGFRGVSNEEGIYNWVDLKLETLQSIIKNNANIGTFIIDVFQLHFMDIEGLKTAIHICHKNNIVVVLDETKTSGRVSRLGISEIYELDFDLLILGKALANGAPLSILLGNKSLMSYARTVRITGTFSKEMLSIWSAIATIGIMDKENGYDKLSKIGRSSCSTINSAIKSSEISDYVECVPVFNGSMFDLKFSHQIVKNKDLREKLRRLLVDEGIILLQGHPSFVCLAHNCIDNDEFRCNLNAAFKKWKVKVDPVINSV